jgi:hypothetical protein
VTHIHSTRIRFYHDPSLEVSADLLAHVAHQSQGYEVQDLLDLLYESEARQFVILVSWLGFDVDDNSWEPLLSLHEDIPSGVLAFLAALPDRDLAARASEALP